MVDTDVRGSGCRNCLSGGNEMNTGVAQLLEDMVEVGDGRSAISMVVDFLCADLHWLEKNIRHFDRSQLIDLGKFLEETK